MDNKLSIHSQKFVTHQKKFTQLLVLFICMLLTSSVLANNTSANNNFKQLIVDGLVCRGNDTTECSFITKKYYQDVGDVVNPDEIADARLRLGTLQQFKNVSIVLEKASQRGRVNVVFIVNEANNIQYLLGSNFNHFNDSGSSINSFGLNAAVTDFNFLGSGKQLSFGVFGQESGPSKNNYLNINYYDPHLLGSVNYFLTAGIGLNQSKFVISSFDKSNVEIDTERYSYDVSLGRRFASHSYAAVHAFGYKINGDMTNIFNPADDSFSPIFSFVYGWDSRDDVIFPTKGSSFSVRVDDSIFKSDTTVSDINGNIITFENQKNVSFGYSDNIRLNPNLIFNYGIEGTVDLARIDELDRQPFQIISLGLTSLDSTHSNEGQYKGWKYGISLPINPDGFEVDSAAFSLGYIYQTDALIVNLSLGYQFSFKEVL